MKELIFGGVCLGKSLLVEKWVVDFGLYVVYLVIVEVCDGEMSCCIVYYCECCLVDWGCVEEMLYFVVCLCELVVLDICILVDCLMLWFFNLLFVG